MKSIKTDCIQETVDYLLQSLREEGLSETTVKDYRQGFSVFRRYVDGKNIVEVTEEVCLDFIESITGKRLSGLHESTKNTKVSRRIRPLYLLLNYEDEGLSCHTSHRNTELFHCPEGFADEYNGYLLNLNGRGLSRTTIRDREKGSSEFILFLKETGIEDSDRISPEHVDSYLMRYKGFSIKYRASIVCHIKDFLGYLADAGHTTSDLRECLPKLRVPRGTHNHHLWTKEELSALLNAVDREGPTGKRDYAILILTIHTGMRAGDVRNLRIKDIDWEAKKLCFVQGKTGGPVELPVSDPVGWAIIDYLRNGRPKTSSDRVFVRHNAPHGALGGTASLDAALSRYIMRAGITTAKGEHYGMHSLRGTLATNMLVSGAPVAVISQTIGHEDPKSTELYLKRDMEGLRLCAIDPDEGCGEVAS